MELKDNFLDICKEKDSYCKFPQLYPRKKCGKAEKCRRWEKQSWSQIFDGVKPCGLKAGEFCHLCTIHRFISYHSWGDGRTLPLLGHKAEPHQKLATATASPISCISLPSHVFFLNLVKGNYNIEPSLSIY
jgi:hypothetical protein